MLAPGGTLVLGGIHMSDIPSFPYELLWHERTIRSVANLTRDDGREFLALAPRVPVRTEVTTYPLERGRPRARRPPRRPLQRRGGRRVSSDHAGTATPPSAFSSPATSVIEAFASPNSSAAFGFTNSGLSTPA